MKIRHERPMPDLAYMVRAPLTLELATGDAVVIEEWSLKGVTFPGDSDLLPTNGVLCIPFQGIDIRFPVRLAAHEATRFLEFADLTGRQRETLALFYRGLLSGKMAATDEIVTSLDTPVDLVPMEETEDEKSEGLKKTAPRLARAARAVLLYVLVAALVFSTLGRAIWDRVTTVPIRHARIEAPLVPHLAADSGFVDRILVAPGDKVRRGQTLVVLSDPELDRSLSEVRGRISLLERRLDKATARERAVVKKIARTSLEAPADSPDGATRDMPQGRAAHVPLAYLPPAEADAYRAALTAPQPGDAATDPALAALIEARRAVQQEIDLLGEELRQLRRERGALKSAGDTLNLIALADGTISELLVIEDLLLPRGAPVLVLEEALPRVARGWVDPAMAAAIHPGMPIRVRHNGGDGPRSYDATIATLEGGVDPQVPGDFGMVLTVTFDDLDIETLRTRFPPGAPLELKALRPTLLDRLQGR